MRVKLAWSYLRKMAGSARIKRQINKLVKSAKSHKELQFSGMALEKLLTDFEFDTVLDVGSGAGTQAKRMREYGKNVTCIDYGGSVYFDQCQDQADQLIGDFVEHNFSEKFDCVWCSHVLEHQRNVGIFLDKINAVLKEGGVLAITVPPRKDQVVGGHVTIWNGGLLLYNLVLAGFDCSEAKVLTYGYNVSVILKKRSITLPGNLSSDRGDIRKLKQYFPKELEFQSNELDDPFDGVIHQIGWITNS
ncbi:class I SAM-dependent methyltransferase [Halopseudomonas sp.]|uniref:class I SAM-dependent methyltransferase n=1 Tax=Halopseudomonas sp. TaxID=2901191 RepID=UPI0030011432